MKDSHFIETILIATRSLAEAAPKQILGIKDCASRHLYCSPYLLELMGVEAADILGKATWLPLYSNDADFEKIIIGEDQAIIDSRQTKMLLKVNRFKTGLTPYFCQKSPLINPATQNVVGLLYQGFELGLFSFAQHIQNVSPKKILLDDKLPHLSKREKQVVFLFLANLSSQEIAEVLYKIEGKKISKSTIDSLFNDQLYAKFEVDSRLELYKKLQMLGYGMRIPQELLVGQSVLLDTMNVY